MLQVPSGVEVAALLPEIILVAAMCAALLLPVLPPTRRACAESIWPMTWTVLAGLVGALAATVMQIRGMGGLEIPSQQILGNSLAIDHFSQIFKVVLYLFTMLVICMWLTTSRRDVRAVDGPDFISLLLGAVLGMSLMASASNFLMVFLAIEAASFPSYALAGFLKSTRRSSEASLKYVLFGSATSAIMVYGLSMIYGQFGTFDLVPIAQAVGEQGMTAGLLLGLFGFIVGIGFKLSAVPTHFWCPDVFEGAPIAVTTFLSVASKGAAIMLLLRVTMTLGFWSPETDAARNALLGISTFIGLIGLATATWGNLAAYFQDNIKRLLAYSSIAHAGYMIMAAGLATATLHENSIAANSLAYAILFYVIVYSFMNLGAFTIAALIAQQTGRESLEEYAGLGVRHPALALLLGCFLMSLFGMPGTGGFWAKVYLGLQMWEQNMWWLVVGLVVNTVFSLYLYLKPIIIMVWKPAEDRAVPALAMPHWIILGAAVGGVFLTGLLPDQTTGWARENARMTFSAGSPPASAESPSAVRNAEIAAAAGEATP